eukprot:CAMPEP_0177636486 /NCGR_PEP_ID=MMETSP0447-20121125/4466_1 /TAXON_ID=0 /ORGANISM="Stygamoeba regulata, Strain BSH-02190019" /LENGTH=510 /DNA_ID=CAMNT_0019138355 /DNA_START=202 /DNA_END=1734 /DNA_ORIENTATION=+
MSSIVTPADPVPAVHQSILSTVGRTPLVKLSARMGVPEGVNLYVKCESFNPMSSVKDRLALGVIEWAEKHGQIKPGQTVVEASSGNTGIGLAMVCAAKGYPFVCVMAESFSIERRKLMRFLGAKVVLTNPAHKGTGMIIKAKELADKHGFFLARQFENEANAWIHRETTGPEITQAFKKLKATLGHFFCAYGTGGTLLGVSQHLREHSPQTKIHLCEPDTAPLVYSGVPTEYGDESMGELSTFKAPHANWRPHLLQGWTTDFIPRLVADAKASGNIDQIHHCGGEAAMATSRRLARSEGIFTGTSGGGILSSALAFAATCPAGTNIAAILPDTGERYLSTPLFSDIPADMTAEEQALADSTPSAAPPGIELPPVTEEATAFVKAAIAENTVVVFSLEYCEFCWTIFRLFDAVGVKYNTIAIDSFKYAKDNMGNKYRSALSNLTGCNTFPQCFIGGKFFGGAADACIKWKSGDLQPILAAAGVPTDGFAAYKGDPFEFLPKWMTKNPLRSK